MDLLATWSDSEADIIRTLYRRLADVQYPYHFRLHPDPNCLDLAIFNALSKYDLPPELQAYVMEKLDFEVDLRLHQLEPFTERLKGSRIFSRVGETYSLIVPKEELDDKLWAAPINHMDKLAEKVAENLGWNVSVHEITQLRLF